MAHFELEFTIHPQEEAKTKARKKLVIRILKYTVSGITTKRQSRLPRRPAE
jgi:hypothetical protein